MALDPGSAPHRCAALNLSSGRAQRGPGDAAAHPENSARPARSAALRPVRIKAIWTTCVRSLRLAAQDVALSRRKQGFESPRERQLIKSNT